MSPTTVLDKFRHVSFAGEKPAPARRPPPAGGPAPSPLPPPRATRPATTAGAFAAWVLERAGLDPLAYRPESLARRAPACLRGLRVASEARARKAIEARPLLIAGAVEALLIGVTGFFRDRPVFDALRARALPRLLAGGRPPRILSAGCSDGAELYSIAIILAEMDALDGAVLLGIDCRPGAIARAREGLFEEAAVEGLDAGLRGRHLSREGARYRVAERLRRAAAWKVDDVLRSPIAGPWDAILFRNVAIYLEADRADRAWRRLAGALAPGGLLVAGKAERPGPETGLRRIEPCIFGKAEKAESVHGR